MTFSAIACMLNVLYLWRCRPMSEKRKNNTIIEGEYYDPDLPAQENTPPQKHRRTRSAGNVPKYNPASESIITKSNDLIQKTKYALPKLEQKVLLAMMAQINPKETPDADRVYSLSFSDFGRLAGVNMHDNTYLEYLKDTVKSLEDRSFWSLDPASDGHQYKVLSWLQRGSTVNDRDKQIRVRFNPEILPYLSQLKSNYTSYNVEYLLTMNSTYSMRFYEILLSYDNGDTDYGYTNGLVFQPVTKEILDRFPDKAQDIRGFKYKVFDIQELKEQLSPPPEKRKKDKEKPLTEKYSNFHDFERYVLTKARDEILLKPGKLTKEEFEVIKKHTVYGYEILNNFKILESTKRAALLHHEKFDGSGYPFGYTADKIDDISAIITIADVYDAMTSKRCYRDGMCPFDVIEDFEYDGISKYHPKYIGMFLKKIASSYIGSTVLLTNGKKAKIIFVTEKYSRPTVTLLEDNSVLVLKDEKDIKIAAVL